MNLENLHHFNLIPIAIYKISYRKKKWWLFLNPNHDEAYECVFPKTLSIWLQLTLIVIFFNLCKLTSPWIQLSKFIVVSSQSSHTFFHHESYGVHLRFAFYCKNENQQGLSPMPLEKLGVTQTSKIPLKWNFELEWSWNNQFGWFLQSMWYWRLNCNVSTSCLALCMKENSCILFPIVHCLN